MPTYYFRCSDCEVYTDVWMSVKEMDTFVCPECSSGNINWVVDSPPSFVGCDVEPMSSKQEEVFYKRSRDKKE